MEKLKQIDYSQALRHVLFAIVVGLACGLASVFLCICIGWSNDVFNNFKWLVWFLPVIGIVEIIAYKFAKLAPNLTTHMVVEQIRANDRISYLLAPGILLTSCMSILCGGSVGKEAGALQIGASLGSLISKPFGIKPIDKAKENEPANNYAAACGMAACFAALFFAPLGSCMFVLELTNFKRPVLKHVLTMLLACFIAYFVASFIGIGDIIPKVELPDMSWHVVGACIVIGVAAAIAGTIFDSGIKLIHVFTQRITKNYYVWVIVGGIIFAVLVTAFGWDAFTGTGGENLNNALHGHSGPWDFLIKMLLTLICLGFWFKGGEIMPSFCIGGLIGASTTYLTGADPLFSAAVGILAFFAAFSRCPFAAFLMGCEIFGWAAAPFLTIAILVSFMFGYPISYYGSSLDHGIHDLARKAYKKLIA